MPTINLPNGAVIEESGVAPVRARPPYITKWAFSDRFTLTERATIDFASIDDPTATLSERMQAATLRTHMADLIKAEYVDLELPALATGLATLEALGLIGAGRAAEILSAPIEESERYYV